MVTKVPEITVVFWLLKLISTGMGEAMSDFYGYVSPAFGPLVGIGGFALAIWLQLRQTEYRAVYYWFAVAMVAVFGTMFADGIASDAGLGYSVTTPIFAALTLIVFVWWYRSEGTLSIHTIDTPRRERFYWAAVFATFTLGTAAGDFTATSLNLGFLDSILLFAGIILIPLIGWWRLHWNPIFSFWFAYLLTRPLGASCADWLDKPARITGLNLGNGMVSWMAMAVFIPLVVWVAIAKFDVQPAANERTAPPPPSTALDLQAAE